jgi:hypothetical protein
MRAYGVAVGMVLAALLSAGSSQAKVVTVGVALPMPVEEGIVLACNTCVPTNPSASGGPSDVSRSMA